MHHCGTCRLWFSPIDADRKLKFLGLAHDGPSHCLRHRGRTSKSGCHRQTQLTAPTDNIDQPTQPTALHVLGKKKPGFVKPGFWFALTSSWPNWVCELAPVASRIQSLTLYSPQIRCGTDMGTNVSTWQKESTRVATNCEENVRTKSHFGRPSCRLGQQA